VILEGVTVAGLYVEHRVELQWEAARRHHERGFAGGTLTGTSGRTMALGRSMEGA